MGSNSRRLRRLCGRWRRQLLRQKRRTKRPGQGTSHDQRDKVQRCFGKPDLSLKRVVLSIGKTEAEVDRPVREAMAEMFDIPLIDSFHDRAHRILSNWCDGRHVGWLALVSLVAKVVAQALQNLVLPWLQ